MATKSRPAAKKIATATPSRSGPPARKAVAPHKPASVKGKVSKEAVKPHSKPAHAAPAKITAHAAATKPHAKPATPRPAVASVSLIDKKHPEKKAADGEIKKKTTVLPPPVPEIEKELYTPGLTV